MSDLLSLSNSLEVNERWLNEVFRKFKKMNYKDVHQFSTENNINYFSVFWFFKGNPVIDSDFKAICNVLGFDWEVIQC